MSKPQNQFDIFAVIAKNIIHFDIQKQYQVSNIQINKQNEIKSNLHSKFNN